MRTGNASVRRRLPAAALLFLALSAGCVPSTDPPTSPTSSPSGAEAPQPAASSPSIAERTPSPAGTSVETASPTPSDPGPAPGPRVFVPATDRPIPEEPGALAAALGRVTRALRTSTDRWLASGPARTERPPERLVLQALFEQRIDRVLMRDPALTAAVLARLPADVRTRVRLTVAAMARLIEGVQPVASTAGFRTGPPEPPGALLGDFQEAGRRFGVPWEVLAAVMYVESKFGRARSASTAGAQGPMQFLPSTWAAYGLGGDIDDPHDAILGAANYLRANGAPGDERGALFAYNHSDRYVDAVLLLAERLSREPRSFYPLYAWQVFVVTTHGDVRLTGP